VARDNKIKVNCLICGKEENINKSRAVKYKTCSLKCMGEYFKNLHSEHIEKECVICKKMFSTKKSHLNRRKYCSKECQAIAYTEKYLGENNPNFRNRNTDSDGYKIDHNGRSKRVHVAVVHEFLNIDKTPEGYNIHHRNCNRMDNRIENLVLLTDSEHRWLHQEFGNAILNAVFNGDIDMNKLISFSKDSEKAKKLLKLCILDQKDIILPKVEI